MFGLIRTITAVLVFCSTTVLGVEYTSPSVGDNMRLDPTDSSMEQCNDYGSDRPSGYVPEVNCPEGEYVVDVWSNGWGTHVVKGITVNLGNAPVPDSSGGLISFTSPSVGDNMRLDPTDSSMEQCNDYGSDRPSGYVPEVNCPAGEYVVDVWSNGWGTHVVKGITVNLGNAPVPDSSGGLISFTSPSAGDNMRLDPTDSSMEQCNDYGSDRPSGYVPEVNCPAGEYVVDVWSNGWGTHVVKGITVNLGSSTVITVGLPRNPNAAFDSDDWNMDVDLLPFSHNNFQGQHYGLSALNDDGVFNAGANDTRLAIQGARHSDFTDPGARPVSPDLEGKDTFATDSHYAGKKGDFRVSCQWSHFGYDDPIIFQNDKGENKSHLHMFWGNTGADWETELLDDQDNSYITNSGGGSCNGFALNRSSYWMPALMHNNDYAIAPKEIIIYYKTTEHSASIGPGNPHTLEQTVTMPKGLQLISGNGDRLDSPSSDQDVVKRNLNKRHETLGGPQQAHTDGGSDWWTTSQFIHWQCGVNGTPLRKFNRIPTASEWERYCEGRVEAGETLLNATIYFPQCRKPDGTPDDQLLRSGDFRDHVRHIKEGEEGCPAGYTSRMPHLGYRVYWDLSELYGTSDTRPRDPDTGAFRFDMDNLRLSSDPLFDPSRTRTLQESELAPFPRVTGEHEDAARNQTFRYTNVRPRPGAACEERVPGGTLHADWIAGWNDEVQKLWLENCTHDGVNCSIGQTGTNLALNNNPQHYDTGHLQNTDWGLQGSYMIHVPTGSMHPDSTMTMPVACM